MPPLLIPAPEDPVRAAAQWLGEADALGRRNANAMALASVDGEGRPSARMVLLKELAPLGYAVFYTNYGSRKAGELLSTGRAAAVLYWHELGRQLRFEGRVVRSPAAESDAYFATRPLASQINAWSSEQSRPLTHLAALEGAGVEVLELQPRIKGCRGPSPGADSGCGSTPWSCGWKGATASTSASATSVRSTPKTLIPSLWAAGARSAYNRSARPRLDSAADDHLSILLGADRDSARSFRRIAAASRRLLGVLPADRDSVSSRGR